MVAPNSFEQEEEEMPIWPMVSISKHKIIFPPSNHENLTISHDFISDSASDSSSDSGLISDSDSHSSFSPSASNSPIFSSTKSSPIVNDVSSMRYVSWIVKTLCSRFYSVVKYLWNSSIVFSRNVVLKCSVVVLCFLYFRRRKRVRDGENGRRRLIRVIDEKEEKINRLLEQVSRMNQVLLGLHKGPTAT